jgi:hypothetical protein
VGSPYSLGDVEVALEREPSRCDRCGGACELVVGHGSGHGDWVWHECVCDDREGSRWKGLEAVWDAESSTWRPTDESLARGPSTRADDVWVLYAPVFYRYLARRMPGVEPLEISTAIGMVTGHGWAGRVDAWELCVLNPGVTLDEARDYLASVAGARARSVANPAAVADVRAARAALERERLQLAALSGSEPADVDGGELAAGGVYRLRIGCGGDYELGVVVSRASTRRDQYEPGWYLEVTPLGEVDLDSCPDRDARAFVDGWRFGAGDPVAAIVLAQAREALHVGTEDATPFRRTWVRYHMARVAALDLPAERRGDALALLKRMRHDVRARWPVDPSGIPEPDQVRSWG